MSLETSHDISLTYTCKRPVFYWSCFEYVHCKCDGEVQSYLGVTLDPYLSWNDHIDYIGRKILAKLAMLRKERKVISRESCLTLYNTMILPVFDYCAFVWDSCSKADREYLDKLHTRAASITEGYTVSQLQISHLFGWHTLQSCRDYLKCMLVFKSLHGLAAAYLLNEFSHVRDFHSYNMCHRDLLRLPLARTTKYHGSFRFSGAKIWNTLPLALRSEHDLNKFKFGLKRHFRSKPNWASNTFAILSCSIFFFFFNYYCFLCCCFFPSGPHANQPRWTGHPSLNIVQNRNKLIK